MIGLFLGKRLGQNFKIVCLLLILTFFVSCAGTDPNGNNGDTDGDTTYYYLPTQNTTVENTKPIIEASPSADFTATDYLYENGNVWYASTTSDSGLRTEINNDGVNIVDYHYIGTNINIIGYRNGGATWYERTTVIPPPPIEDGLDDISLTSPEGSKYQDYIEKAVNKGTTPWVDDLNGYNPSAGGQGGQDLVSSVVDLVKYKDGFLGIDIVQSKEFTTDGKFYLFTSTLTSQPLTFSLLLVSKTDNTRGKYIPNVKYLDYEDDPRHVEGKIGRTGDYYWVIDTGFKNVTDAPTLTSLADCEIYMIVHKYEGLTEGGGLKDKNVIKIK